MSTKYFRNFVMSIGAVSLLHIMGCGEDETITSQSSQREKVAKAPQEIQIEILRKSDVAEVSPKDKEEAPLAVDNMQTPPPAVDAPVDAAVGAPYAGAPYGDGFGAGPYPGYGGDFGLGFGPGFGGPLPFFDPIGPFGFDDDDDGHRHHRKKKKKECTKKETDDGDPNIPFPE